MIVWGKQKGFTLVELLIVIVVIVILAAVTIAGYSGMTAQSAKSKRDSDIATLMRAIHLGRVATGKTLGQMTGSYWSTGSCSAGGSNPDGIEPRNLPVSHACWVRYYGILSGISEASGVDLSGLRAGDARGNPYVFDENEGEGGDFCRTDGSIMYFTGSGSTMVVVGPKIEKLYPSC